MSSLLDLIMVGCHVARVSSPNVRFRSLLSRSVASVGRVVSSSAGVAVRFGRIPTGIMLGLLLVAGRADAAVAGDEYSTSGGGNIVSDARAWWENHTDEFRTGTSHCLQLLDEAETHRRQALDYYAKARDPHTPSTERSRLQARGNAEYQRTSDLVRAFIECTHARPPSPPSRPADATPRRPPTSPGIAPPPQRAPEPLPPPEDDFWSATLREHPDCAALIGHHKELTRELNETLAQAAEADPADRPPLMQRIDSLAAQRARIQAELYRCVGFNPAQSGGSNAPRMEGGVTQTDEPSADQSAPGQAPPDQPSRPPLAGGTERICDLQQLAAWVFRNYDTRHAIAYVRVVNATRPTYLLLLSGMTGDPASANTLGQAYVAWANIQAFDAYRRAIFDALSNLHDVDLIIAGHSQGGMEAQNIVENLVQRWGFRVPQVISFGAPVTTSSMAGTGYTHVQAPDDAVPQLLQRRILLDPRQIISSAQGTIDPHRSYPLPESGLSVYRVPGHETLRTPCYEIDLTTLREFEAPNLFNQFRGDPDPRELSRTPYNPAREHRDLNCFWVSLAYDWACRTGIQVPAQGELVPIPDALVAPTLSLWYGAQQLDDRHGPTPAAGIARHAAGERATPATRASIEAALSEEGSRGLVFMRDPAHPELAGHVFNARRVGDRVVFEDHQQGTDASFRFAPGFVFEFYRTN